MDGSDVARAPEWAVAPARRIPGEVFDARREARRIVDEARAEAEAIRSSALEEASRIVGEATTRVEEARRLAAEDGRAEGVEEGLARAAAEVLRGARERERLLAGCAGEALDLAVAMAERILEREVRPGTDATALAAVALERVAGRGRPVIRVSPADADTLALPGGAPGLAARVVVDAGLRPGEVVVRAGPATVDGTFPARLGRLRRALEGLEG